MSHNPTPATKPCYVPSDDRYWDARDLEQELRRTLDICHPCRMCLPYCGSFPDLFAKVDGHIGRGEATGAEALKANEIDGVVDLCFQCKLCYFKCPYTEDEKHPWMLDVPRLFARAKAQKARRDGVTLQDQVLGEPQLLGQLTAGPMAPVANLLNAQSLVRKAGEKIAGISSKFPVPPFAREPFSAWWKRHSPPEGVGEHGEVVLFATCFGDYNVTAPTIAAVKVLEANKVKVHYVEGLTCCGMPNLDGGDVPRAQEKAAQNVAALIPYVTRGMPILIPSPTCSYMLTKEYGELLGTEDARAVAKASSDLLRWIDVNLRRQKKLNKDFKHPLGRVAIQAPCHLRAQKIAVPGATLLEAAGADVEVLHECSAVDGTWGMKAQYYELGRKYAQKLIRGMREAEADRVVTDCPLSALRLSFELGVKVVHPIEALAEAYGLNDVEVKS